MSQTVELERVEQRLDTALSFIELLLPLEFPLTFLASIVGKDPSTVRKHLYTHYKEGTDYNQPKKNGKIYVARHAALAIKEKYAK